MEHTPGPWTVGQSIRHKGICIDSKSGWVGEAVAWPDSPACVTSGSIEHKANARLIAAAPELLAKLEALVRRSDNGDSIEPGWWEILDARTAIKAAKGEA